LISSSITALTGISLERLYLSRKSVGHYILSKIFPPYEVKVTLGEVDAFLNQHAFLCKDVVRSEVASLAKVADKTVHSIRIDHMKPDHLALVLITNVLGRHLSSGQHHTYRGVLGMVGSDMLKVWSAAISRLKERGYYSADEADQDMQWIRDQVKAVG